MKHKVLCWIAQNQKEIVKFLQDILKISSVNPWFKDDTYPIKEKEIQQFIEKHLRDMGFETYLWEPNSDKLSKYEGRAGYYPNRDFTDRPNLFAELTGNGNGKSILLTGHVDVVKAGEGWTVDPFGGTLTDGRIYGRGAADMKGGIAAMIMAVKAILEAGVKPSGDISIGTVVDEEAGGMGTLALADMLMNKDYIPDGCILTEATNLNIAPLCRGILWGKLTIAGRSGHIEMPQGDWRTGGAVDAIEKAKIYLNSFDQMNKDWALRKVHPLLPIPCQLNVAQLNAGEYPTSYANSAEITFNAQYLPTERDELLMGGNVKKEIEEFVQKVAQTDPWLKQNPPKIEWMIDADCAETEESHPFVTTMSNTMFELDQTPKIEGICAHTDMGWLVNIGIPTVNFGPGEPRIAHQTDEYITADQLIEATKIIAISILNWCGYERE